MAGDISGRMGGWVESRGGEWLAFGHVLGLASGFLCGVERDV